MTTLYGIYNVCFHPAANPKPRYYLTRKARNAALGALRVRAIENGLAVGAALAGIYPVKLATQDERLIGDAWENETDEDDASDE